MKLLYTALILFIFPSIILAQSNYYPGYVIKSNGDTLKGYVNYREWQISPKSIDFKINKDDKQRLQFNPVTIKKFQINGMETYISFIGMITMNSTTYDQIFEHVDTVKVNDTLFLRQTLTGKHMTLFSQEDKIKTRYFIAKTNDTPIELLHYVSLNSYNQMITSPRYNGQLMLYVNEFDPRNDKLAQMAAKARYDLVDLEPIVNLINNNNGKSVQPISTSRLFISLGLNNTITEVNNVTYLSGVQHSTTISPKIGAGLDIFQNPHVQQLIFRVEMSFSYVNPQYKYSVTVNSTNTYESYSFNQYTAALTPQILFNVYNKNNFKVYIDAGVAFNFSAYSNDIFTIKSSDPAVINAYTVHQLYKLEPYWLNFPLQAGVVLNKRIEIYLTRIGYASFTRYNDFYAANQTISIGAKYLFGKN